MRPWQRPIGEDEHGSLAALLLGLTFASGIVDAVSFLGLGHVFVAAMTAPSERLSTAAVVTEVPGALAGALLLLDVAAWSALALGVGCEALVVAGALTAG